jgi:hypothetical protein
MRYFLLFLFLVAFFSAAAQHHGFPFGQAKYHELEIKKYAPDTSAVAVVLDEFGEAYFNNYSIMLLLHNRHNWLLKRKWKTQLGPNRSIRLVSPCRFS